MAQDAEKRGAIEGRARKEVSFDIADLDQRIGQRLYSENHYRRRSSLGATDSVKELESISDGEQQDNEDGDIKSIAEKVLESYSSDKIEQYRYSLTTETLRLAIQQGISDLAAETCSIDMDSSCRFIPFTQIGDKVWPAVSRPMDTKLFVEEVNNNSEAMFQEFKFRTLGVVSLYQNIKELHQIAETLNSNQETIYNILTKPALKVLSSSSNDYIEEIITRDKKIQDLTLQVNESNQVITDLMIRSRQQTGSVEKMTSSPSSQYTEGGTKVTRSARVEDPEQYFNEPGKDLLEFDAWRLGIEARLRDNADWFSTEDQRINYVMRRLAGRASRETVPFLKSSNPERFKKAEEMLDHLESQYGDTDRGRKAKNDWDNLRMIYPETYGSKGDPISYVRFRNCFTRLASELGHSRKEWKSAFERRISPTLQKTLALQFLDDSVDFPTIAKLAQKVDYTNAVADAATRAKRAAEKDSKFSSKSHLGASSQTSNSNGQYKNLESKELPKKFPGVSAPTKDQFHKATKEGLCLTCPKPGHKSYECRKNASQNSSAQNRENRINNLYQKMFPEKNDIPKLDTDNVVLDNQEDKESGNL